MKGNVLADYQDDLPSSQGMDRSVSQMEMLEDSLTLIPKINHHRTPTPIYYYLYLLDIVYI